jgi:hypothetical protein
MPSFCLGFLSTLLNNAKSADHQISLYRRMQVMNPCRTVATFAFSVDALTIRSARSHPKSDRSIHVGHEWY